MRVGLIVRLVLVTDDIHVADIEFPAEDEPRELVPYEEHLRYKYNTTLIPNPQRIYDELSKSVVGQDDAKKTLSIVAYNHLLRFQRNCTSEYLAPPPRLTTMIIGNTGSGKSLMCNKLCDYLGLPICKIDATMLVPSGASGDNIIDKLIEYKQQNKYNDNYNYGVIYIDEIDKLFRTNLSDESHNAGYYSSLMYSLLTVIDGTHNEIDGLDTNKLLFIFSGAFEFSSAAKKSRSGDIGFKADHTSKCDNSTLSREDIEEHSGIPRELLARINVITQTYQLSRDEIRDVLTNCAEAVLPQFESTFLMGGSQLELTNDELDAIIEKVHKSKYGMRYNKTILFEYLKDKLFSLKG